VIDFQTPLAGLERASASLDRAASRIAAAADPAQSDSVDLSSEMIAVLEARNSFESNVKVAQTQDEMTRSLLNVLG
jgi:flagellar basal body rod protein FlgG